MTQQARRSVSQIDRLMDAIELIQAERREEALPVLRGLIQEDKDFEDAWLWMSVAVESIDKSIICLDNVLRINPDNVRAAGALYRLQEAEVLSEQQRAKLRFNRDMALMLLWILILTLLFATLFSFGSFFV